ncbi:MAG TPA: PilZ domain-containing protein [Planctomycetota bacterium]|nr:PilZ domain-containing protein [Planctomycetota bacterium]
MEPAKERRKHQRQTVLLPLRVTEEEAGGKLLFQGNTVTVGAGGVYFRTLNWQDLPVGMPVHVTIDIPPEMFQLLPFGGLRGVGKVIRVERPTAPDGGAGSDETSSEHGGVAVRMMSRLRFDPDLHLPRFDRDRRKPN